MKTVIFDLDGTLADTSRDLINAANAVLDARGQDCVLDPALDAGVGVRGGRAMFTLGFERLGLPLTEQLMDALYHELIEAYRARIDEHTRFYDGALAAVEALRAGGYKTGVCTNKPEDLAELLLTRLGVRSQFDSLIGARTVGVPKPDPAPFVAAVERAGGAASQSILIGDTRTDYDTARAAGVPIVLVEFGPEPIEGMEPDAVLPHYEKLMEITKELIG